MPETGGRLVIVGAGQAGYWVSATVRELQPDREIVLIGDEPHVPYERPPLSKQVLSGTAVPESTQFKPPEYYFENRIDLRVGTKVTSLDRREKSITLSSGNREHYGTLVLATGLRPRALQVPGSEHPKVVALRNLADVRAIQPVMSSGKRLIAIGAGFIGLEVAATARNAGADVTVIEAQEQALGRLVAPEVSAAIVSRHKLKGVQFRFGETVLEISDRGGQPELHLTSGEALTADLVLVGIGATPNEDLALQAGIVCQDGIVVDETGITSDPCIYAAGDVCRQYNSALRRTIRLESWQNAQNQSISVGKRIAGQAEQYHEMPWFWTDQYDFNFQLVGVPDSFDELIWRGKPEDDAFTVIYMKDGCIVGGNTLNNSRDIRPLKRLILERSSVETEVLADTSTSIVKIHKMKAAQ